eukprot:TRINITY_DN3340_c0_g1_i1.p1 TRINITY_DN3340_c0_g1~~TRINITY_DN3340_c0_g1_i1.p1  ORF type:complete len:421 (-),score=109.07 TRINITY_DN3340_c0_g1_i1:42-1304(-)
MALPTVPNGLSDVIRGLAREVIREQPTDIPAFAANYFEHLLNQRTKNGEFSNNEESNISIAENIVAILSNQDPEHNGVVPRGAVYEALKAIRPPLSQRQILASVSEADIDSRGLIEYHTFAERAERASLEAASVTQLTAPTNPTHIRGLPRDSFNDLVAGAVAETGSAIVGQNGLADILLSLDLALTRRELSIAAFELNESDYDATKLADALWNLLVQIDGIDLWQRHGRTPQQWADAVLEAVVDHLENPEFMPRRDLREALRTADLGLTSKHILVVLTDVSDNTENNKVPVAALAKAAGRRMALWFDRDRASQLAHVMDSTPTPTEIHGQNREQVQEALTDAFTPYDHDRSGRIILPDLRTALSSLTAFRLTSHEINSLLSVVDSDLEGYVAYTPLLMAAYDILAFVGHQEAVDAAMAF